MGDVYIKSMLSSLSKGFTLVEILIVVIILGILASLSIPKLVENIDRVRATEAFMFGGMTSWRFNQCVAEENLGQESVTTATVMGCNSFQKIGLIDPNLFSSNFDYQMAVLPQSTVLRMAAVGKFKAADPETDVITFDLNGATGQVTKVCEGKYLKMCRD